MEIPYELETPGSLESGELTSPLLSTIQGNLRFSGNPATELVQGWDGGVGQREEEQRIRMGRRAGTGKVTHNGVYQMLNLCR